MESDPVESSRVRSDWVGSGRTELVLPNWVGSGRVNPRRIDWVGSVGFYNRVKFRVGKPICSGKKFPANWFPETGERETIPPGTYGCVQGSGTNGWVYSRTPTG